MEAQQLQEGDQSFGCENAPFRKRNNIAKLLYCPELIENLLLCCQSEKLKKDIFMCVILPYLETVDQILKKYS